MESSLGRCGLTILPSKLPFLSWCKEKAGRSLAETDFALLILGTNDITQLRRRAMEWSKDMSDKAVARKVQAGLHKALTWIRQFTIGTIIVVEPVNMMTTRTAENGIIVKAMEQEVSSFSGAQWLPMHWKHADLQRPLGKLRREPDPKHFNCKAARRMAAEVERLIGGR
mmetsp:Transcript_81953/g.155645  ORF Transcript_81953/g.155645 Transcript_81953/m.155645 type:complete len:169 (-) Transcript_81953:126-632(-)